MLTDYIKDTASQDEVGGIAHIIIHIRVLGTFLDFVVFVLIHIASSSFFFFDIILI